MNGIVEKIAGTLVGGLAFLAVPANAAGLDIGFGIDNTGVASGSSSGAGGGAGSSTAVQPVSARALAAISAASAAPAP